MPFNITTQFPGGDKALNDFIGKNIHVQKEGKVYVNIELDTLGNAKSIKIEPNRLLNANEEKDILNAFKLFPKLKPTILNGRAIPFIYQLPITLKRKFTKSALSNSHRHG